MNTNLQQLNCLVLAHKEHHQELVSNWLSVSKKLDEVSVVTNEHSLCQKLGSANDCHLCIIVVESAEDTLPACTLQHPDMRLLVLTANRNAGKFTQWLQQGATDVVTMKNAGEAQHAISRLIDECLTDLHQTSLESRIEQLEHEANFLRSVLHKQKRSFVIAASNDSLNPDDMPAAAEQVEEDLHCDDQPTIKNVASNQKLAELENNSNKYATKARRFQEIMETDIKAPRFTAMLVRISDNKNADGSDGTTSDFSFLRAADKLQKQLVKGTIFGRVNKNAILLIQSSDIEPVSRDAANRVRKTLDALAGSAVSKEDIHINTMSLPAKTRISVDEMVARLEATR